VSGETHAERQADVQRRMAALNAVSVERHAQDQKWGVQNHPDGTGAGYSKELADTAREATQIAAENGFLTWRHILTEEFYEAIAECRVDQLRTELIQVAAVAVAWVEAIDRRANA